MSDIADASNWRVDDPAPDVPLDQIGPIASRARALLARHKAHPAVAKDFPLVLGVLDMFGALDYHFANIQRLEATYDVNQGNGSATYEALAYLAAVGRFDYFARTVPARGDSPTIRRLMPFRHKAAAHRSIDMPEDESLELLHLHALSMRTGAMMLRPRSDGKHSFKWQIQRELGEAVDFVPDEDHDRVMSEAYSTFAQFLA